ncbi:MAG TPA: ATP-binding protein [Kribbellaceae bacterium]
MAATCGQLDRFAYRIVQEALTNVLKHAGLGAHTEVRLDSDRRGIIIEFVDDGHGRRRPRRVEHRGGRCSRSRHHRDAGAALLLGGSLDVPPRSDCGAGS